MLPFYNIKNQIITGSIIKEGDITENTNMEIFIEATLNKFEVVDKYNLISNFYIKDGFIYFKSYEQLDFIDVLKNCPFIDAYDFANIYVSYKIEDKKYNYINGILPIKKRFSINSFERFVRHESFIYYWYKKICNMIG